MGWNCTTAVKSPPSPSSSGTLLSLCRARPSFRANTSAQGPNLDGVEPESQRTRENEKCAVVETSSCRKTAFRGCKTLLEGPPPTLMNTRQEAFLSNSRHRRSELRSSADGTRTRRRLASPDNLAPEGDSLEKSARTPPHTIAAGLPPLGVPQQPACSCVRRDGTRGRAASPPCSSAALVTADAHDRREERASYRLRNLRSCR